MQMRRILTLVCATGLVACGTGDAFRGRVDVVARAGSFELHRDTLAAVFAVGKTLQLRRDYLEQFTHRWVEFALYAERVVQGDSLLDSATVAHAMWPDANQWLVDEYHDQLVADRVQVDSATVDSAFAAGEHRLIDHILVRTTPDMSPPQRADAQRKAERLRESLESGGSWERVNEENDDPVARRQGGSLGVIERGQMVTQFEDAAFALGPGELSELVQTQYGFHIVRRPPLNEVRRRYHDAIEEVMVGRMDGVILEEIETRWEVSLRSGAPSAMREAASAPLSTFTSPKVIGTYRDGKFTTADFVRWLQALPTAVYQNVGGASDDQLRELGRSLLRNEALVREARRAGMTLSEEDWESLRDRLRGELTRLEDALGLDSSLATVDAAEERHLMADQTLKRYLRQLAESGGRGMVVVPAFLADKLRQEMEWEVSSAGLDQALELVQRLKQQATTAETGEQVPMPVDTVGGEDARDP
jgi:hypothetical protein